jgi:hypothetical protein
MWYSIVIDDIDYVMFFDGGNRNVFIPDESNYMHADYFAWVAEGNTAEEWTGA